MRIVIAAITALVLFVVCSASASAARPGVYRTRSGAIIVVFPNGTWMVNGVLQGSRRK